LIYGSKITAASRGFPATARLSCYLGHGVDVLLTFARWHHYFHKLIEINYGLVLSMKWLWFLPNLVRICSIFLQLQAVIAPFILAYPVDRA